MLSIIVRKHIEKMKELSARFYSECFQKANDASSCLLPQPKQRVTFL